MKYTLIFVLLAVTLAKSQPVCYSNGWEGGRYGSWNVMQISRSMPTINPYWQTWAKIDCPVHVYEISQRDKTGMPNCYILISRAIEPPTLPVVPKLVSYRKKYNGA